MSSVLKSGSLKLLEPSGTLQACNGTALPVTSFIPIQLIGVGTCESLVLVDSTVSNTYQCVPVSSVGIATDYGLESTGSNPGGGGDIFRPFRQALGPTQPNVQWVQGVSRR